MAEQAIQDEPALKEPEQPVDAGYGEEEQLYDNAEVVQVQQKLHTPWEGRGGYSHI